MKSKAKEFKSPEGRGGSPLGGDPSPGLGTPFQNLGQGIGGRGLTINLAVAVWVGSAIQGLSGDRSKPRLKVASLLGLLAPNRKIPKYFIW